MKGKDRRLRWPTALSGYSQCRWKDLPRDVMAGITLAALIIPLNIGYTQVAGLPPVTGLYSAILPLIVFALLTSSRHVVGSPEASIIALVGSTLSVCVAPGDPMRIQYAQGLAIMCGVIFILFWYFRLAFLANFLSHAVLVGFFSGLGLEVFTKMVGAIMGSTSHVKIAASQMKEAINSPIDTHGFIFNVIGTIQSLPQANLYSASIGLGVFAIIRLLKYYAPKIPGTIIALVLMTTLATVFHWQDKGVVLLGSVPSGLPSISLPSIPFTDYVQMMPGAMAIVVISLCETLMLVRKYARKHSYKADGDQLLFALGAANIAAGGSNSLIVACSPARTAAMDDAGTQSQVPSLVAAGTLVLVMLFFSESLAYLPVAALAAVVANATLSLIDIRGFRELYRIRQSEFWIAVVCMVCVLAFGPLRAVIVAFLLTTIDIVRRASAPSTWVLQRRSTGFEFVPTNEVVFDDSGIIVYSFGTPLYFANANILLEDVEKLFHQRSGALRSFVLDAESISDIDSTGAQSLQQAISLVRNSGASFAIARANPMIVQLLKSCGIFDNLGEDRLYSTIHAAIDDLENKKPDEF